jgi:cobalt-zinc-cadmium efflux system membrane fusion protein
MEGARRLDSAGPVFKAVQAAGVLTVVVGVLVIFLGFVLEVPLPGLSRAAADTEIKPPAQLGVELVKGRPHTLRVPPEVRSALGIRKGGKDRVEVVKAPAETRPLVLYGSTALDPTRLMRIRARFAPAEVVSIGQVRDLERSAQTGRSEFRELRPGDRVRKGDVLGVFFSVDVGSKKNDLLDALVQLALDQKILERAEKQAHAVPEVFLLNAQRAVQGDRNAVNRAWNNLKVWNIPEEEIDALQEEARKISADKNAWFRTPAGRWVKKAEEKMKSPKGGNGNGKTPVVGKVDPAAGNDNPWGRVTLRAPFDGIIVERNIVPHEIVQDPTTCLFQIAQVQRLLVIASAPEDELPNLNGLRFSERRWTVKTVGPTAATELPGPIEEIGYLIDPNQHTAVIKGYIDNPEEKIRAGQFVSATVRIPPPAGVVEVPLDAVVEDGQMCVVFVQPDPSKPHYTMRRVQLTHRFEKVAFARSTPFAEQERYASAAEKEQGLQPLEPLRPGERVLKTGVGELKAALLDLESRR